METARELAAANHLLHEMQRRHAAQHLEIHNEEDRPRPDELLLRAMKAEKLRLKDTIARTSGAH